MSQVWIPESVVSASGKSTANVRSRPSAITPPSCSAFRSRHVGTGYPGTPISIVRPKQETRIIMKSRAAVAFAPGEPLEIVELDVAPPKKGEVLVRISHTGVLPHRCLHVVRCGSGGHFSRCPRSRRCGCRHRRGEGVTSVAPGDHVISLYTAECREWAPIPSLRIFSSTTIAPSHPASVKRSRSMPSRA